MVRNKSMLEARAQYFADNHFPPDGGDSEAWVNFKLGPLPMPFPNSDARRRAVRYHDLHHVVTGYATDIVGEFEISAWELGAGCGRFAAAWLLNLGGLIAGLFIAPKKVWSAFVWGRRTRTLYSMPFEPLLAQRVDDVRSTLGLNQAPARATLVDAVLLTASVALAFAVWLPLLALTPVIFVPWFIAGRRYLASLG